MIINPVQSHTYFSPRSMVDWNGICGDPSCDAIAPCRVYSGHVSGSLLCEFHFYRGDYSGKDFSFSESSSAVVYSIETENVTNLSITFEDPRSVEFSNSEGFRMENSRVIAYSNNEIEFVHFQEMALHNVHLDLGNVSSLYFEDSNATWTIETPQVLWNGSTKGQVKIENSNILSPNAPLMQAPYYEWAKILVDSSVLDVQSLAVATSESVSQLFLTFDNSNLNFTRQSLIQFANYQSVLAVPAMNYSAIAYRMKGGLGNFTNGIISQFVSDGTRYFNIHMESTDFFLDDTDFKESSVISTGKLFFVYSRFSISGPNSKLLISSSSESHIDDLNVMVDNQQAYRQPFQLGGIPSTPSACYSNINTNMVWISSDVCISEFRLTDFIGKAYPTPVIPQVSSLRSGSDWYFGSVAVVSVQLDLSRLDTFTYNVTKPFEGTLHALPTSERLTAVVPSQTMIIDTTVPLASGTWYPIFVDFNDQGTSFEFTPAVSLDSRRFQMELSKAGNALSFRRYPIGLAPSTPGTDGCGTNILPGFECIDGTWVAIGSIDTPTLTIPSGNVVVLGNLTTLSPISFSGTNSNLNVTECLSTPGVEINLEDQTDPSKSLSSKSFVLISQGSGCSQPLGVLPISVKQSKKSCKKVKVEPDTQQSSSNTLAVLFTIDNSKCNVKWIILGSVLGGAVVILLIILILIFTLNTKARHSIRPFSAPRPTQY